MPRYDLECKQCSAIWDVHIPLDKLEEELECPVCKKTLKRLMPAPAGWVH